MKNFKTKLIFIFLILINGCNPPPSQPPASVPTPDVATAPTSTTSDGKVEATQAVEATVAVAPDIEKGKKLYMANCLSCHNKDPNVKGSIGPEQADTPLEVMQVKIATGRYPEVLPSGYTPKRKTKAMRAFPKLKDEVVHIHAWIQSMKK